MKKLRIFLLGILFMASAYAGFQVIDSLTAQTAHLGSDTSFATFDSGGMLTFTGPSAGLDLPYIMLSDSTSQTIVNVASGQAITYNSVDDNNNMTLSGTSKIVVQKHGDYEFLISAVADVSSNGDEVWIWAAINGVYVTGSNTEVTMPAAYTTVIAAPFIFDLEVGDYVEFYFGSNNAAGRLVTIAAATNPIRPSVPSIIVTGKRISNSH